MFRRLLSVFLCLALLVSAAPCAQANDLPAVSAHSCVLMNADGRVLYGLREDEALPMASTTKLMTAMVVLEHSSPDDVVEIPAACCDVEGSSMYLRPGERYTVRELLYGLLLVSGNDAALALAEYAAGSEAAFVRWMNEKAEALGMRHTQYVNPHGLSAEGHVSSAADLGLLMAACLRVGVLIEIAGTRSVTVGEQTLFNHNKLLGRCPGCLAGKTGYTEAAGRCLVSCCEREGTRLICVTMDDPNDWDDHCALYDWGFAAFSTREVTATISFAVPVVSGETALVRVEAEPLRVFLPRSAEVTAAAELPRFVFAPVSEGETAGVVRFLLGGEVVGESKLYYTETVQTESREPIWRRGA